MRELTGQEYSKYENKVIVARKSLKLALSEQKDILRKICMWARLIEEVLKLKLEEDFE